MTQITPIEKEIDEVIDALITDVTYEKTWPSHTAYYQIDLNRLRDKLREVLERKESDYHSETRWLYHYLVVEPNPKFVRQILEDVGYKLPPPEAIQFLRDIPQYEAKEGDVWTKVKNGWSKPVYKNSNDQQFSARMAEVFVELGAAQPMELLTDGNLMAYETK